MTKDEALKLAFEALKDMNCGWKYIRESHGDLYGVGWDRAQQKADDAIAALRQALEQPVSFYVYEWVNQSDGIVFRSFRHDEHHMGREPDRTIAFTKPDTGIDRGAWSDVPDATKWVDELRGDEDLEEPPNSTTDVVEPAAWSVLDKRTGKHWYTHESKYTSQYYANLYSHRETDGSPSMVVTPLYAAPTPQSKQECETCANKRRRLEQSGFLKSPMRESDDV
jgi:hypothetical protein